MTRAASRALEAYAPRGLNLCAPTELEQAAERARKSHRQVTTEADREHIRLKTKQLARELGKVLKHVGA